MFASDSTGVRTTAPGRLKNLIILLACALLLGILPTGCALTRYIGLGVEANDMPEEVLIKVPMRNRYRPRVVVCDFQSPEYAGDVGTTASTLLFGELLKRHVRADRLPAAWTLPSSSDGLATWMKASDYDMLVMGKVSFYLDGMISTDSRVESEMVVYATSGGALQTVGLARAVERASPRPSAFFLSMRDKGSPAPSAERLLQHNSAKFARMIETMTTGR